MTGKPNSWSIGTPFIVAVNTSALPGLKGLASSMFSPGRLSLGVKAPSADFDASIVSVQVGPVCPSQSSPQPANPALPEGEPVSLTTIPRGKSSVQSPGQWIPAGDEVTEPLPVPPGVVTVRVSGGGGPVGVRSGGVVALGSCSLVISASERARLWT